MEESRETIEVFKLFIKIQLDWKKKYDWTVTTPVSLDLLDSRDDTCRGVVIRGTSRSRDVGGTSVEVTTCVSSPNYLHETGF